jgi:hypothetical protein
MVEVRGAPYIKKSNRAASHSPSPSPPRVIRTGPSYIRSSFPAPIVHPYPVYVNPTPHHVVIHSPPPPLVVDSSPGQVVVVRDVKTKRRDDLIGALVIGTILLIAAASIAVSISRDCKWIRDDCTPPDLYGNQLCTPIYDCKW